MTAEYVTTAQAAKRLQVATGTIQKMVDAGVLVGWKTSGGHRRILIDSLETYIHKQDHRETTTTSVISDTSSKNAKLQKNVLIIEDSHFFAAKLREFLHMHFDNARVEISHSAFDAINLVSSTAYDAIILDMKMPGFDGFSFFNQLSVNLPSVASSVIILTELDAAEVKQGINSYKIPQILTKSDFENSLPKLLTDILNRIKAP